MPAVRSGVLYLQKDKFQMYSPFVNGILEFKFTPDVVRDLDVISLETLGNQVKVFVANGKVAPSNLVIVLCDNAYFVKDFVYETPAPPAKPGQPPVPAGPKRTLEDLQKDADQFVEHVPYDNVVSKTFPLKNGIRVCAANQDLYTSIKVVFEALGFTVSSVFPGMVLGPNVSNRPVMDMSMANLVLQKAGTLKQYDLLPQSAFEPQAKGGMPDGSDDVEVEEQQDPKKPNKKRLIAMSGVLVSLIILLVIVYVQSQTPPTPPQQPAVAAPQAPPPAVSAAQTQITTVPDATQMQSLTVQIVNASSSATQAQSLRNSMTKYKFKELKLQPQSNVGSSGTVVSFSPTVNQSVRNTVLDEVRKIKENIVVQEKPESTIDITILIGN